MRNAFQLFSVVGLLSVVGVSSAAEPSITQPSGSSIYAPALPSADSGINDLLPVRGSDLPLAGPTGLAGASASGTQVVEAIPTPTAFQAGSVLIAGILAVRFIRKLRMN